MKTLITTFKNIQLFGFLVGLAMGTFTALLVTYFYVNEGHARMRGYSMSQKYLKETCMRKFGSEDRGTTNINILK